MRGNVKKFVAEILGVGEAHYPLLRGITKYHSNTWPGP